MYGFRVAANFLKQGEIQKEPDTSEVFMHCGSGFCGCPYDKSPII